MLPTPSYAPGEPERELMKMDEEQSEFMGIERMVLKMQESDLGHE
jgi:hypothetical protein